jgi:hypothetical protein
MNYLNSMTKTYGPKATNYMNGLKDTYGPKATNYMNGLKEQYTPLINNSLNQGLMNLNQGLMNQGTMNQNQGLMNQSTMNQNQGLMNQNQGLMNQSTMNQNQGVMNQPQGSDRFGIPVSTYKQGFLNTIARWNVSSGTSNSIQRMGNNSMSVQQIQSVRDQRIRQALNEVLAMPNLGKYQALNAFGDTFGNYANYMVNGFSNKTRGGKRRRRRGTRRHRK